MSDRCEPPEHRRGVDGWHWVQIADWPPALNRWVWDAHEDSGYWRMNISEGTRYVAPVTPPATVAALVEALEMLSRTRGMDQLNAEQATSVGAALALYRGEAGR